MINYHRNETYKGYLSKSIITKMLIVLNYLHNKSKSGCTEIQDIKDCYQLEFKEIIKLETIENALKQLVKEEEIEMIRDGIYRPFICLSNANLSPSTQWALLNGLYIKEEKNNGK